MEFLPFSETDASGRGLFCPPLAEAGGFAHCFTTRRGGVSRGVFASLNMSASRGDEPRAVEENFRLAAASAGMSGRFAFTRQVHGAKIRAAGESDVLAPAESGRAPECDGLAAARPGFALVGMFADCVPILLADPAARACAVVHAGWRGTAAGIAHAAVRFMEKELGSKGENLVAAVGPAISKCCFLCHDDAALPLGALGSVTEGHISPSPDGRRAVDLKAINGEILRQSGVKKIFISGDCTCCDPAGRFFSHRRDGAARGSMAALIEIL